MCCRYYFDNETFRDACRIVEENSGEIMAGSGDVHPADEALVIAEEHTSDRKLCTKNMRWGFAGYDKQLLINARAESALEKPTFRDSVMYRRCIVPAKHFYEWDKKKNKNIFRLNESGLVLSPSLYMAGCYTLIQNELCFVILTTGANTSMLPVHDRMPLILPESQMKDWILSENLEQVRAILGQPSPMLKREQEYEQMSLFDL